MQGRAIVALLGLLVPACRAAEPPNNPEEVCVQACGQRAKNRCTDDDCRRGCRLALDRLVEHEGDHVIACVAGAKTKLCDDSTWAECAVKVGLHADGGPPVPARPGDDDE
jgi:hypothetical protein